jgi:hypothetical protein
MSLRMGLRLAFNMSQEESNVKILPIEIRQSIFSELSPKDLANVGQTCSEYNTETSDDVLWGKFLKNPKESSFKHQFFNMPNTRQDQYQAKSVREEAEEENRSYSKPNFD